MAHSANKVSTVHVNNTDYDVHDAEAEHLVNKVTTIRDAVSASDEKYPSEKAVRTAISSSTGAVWGSITGTLSNQTDLNTALGAKAPTASPALTGTPTAPTAAAGTNNTQLATTAFVKSAVDTAVSSAVKYRGTKTDEAAIKAITSASLGDMWIETTNNTEWVCKQNISVATPSAWEQLGPVSQQLGDMAYSNSASGSAMYRPVINLDTTGTTNVYSITNVGTLPTHAADTFTQGSFTQGTFSGGTTPTWSATVTNEVLSFSFDPGTVATHGSDSFVKPTFTSGTFSQGTLPTQGAAQTVAAGDAISSVSAQSESIDITVYPDPVI